jgi:hypothetical protein
VVLNQEPPPDTLIYAGQLVTYDVKASGGLDLPDARQEAVVRHQVPYDWYNMEVRVDLIDRLGNRQTVWTRPPLYDEQARQTYTAGKIIRIPVTYIDEATVEIYMDGELVESYYLSGGAEPAPGAASAPENAAGNPAGAAE